MRGHFVLREAKSTEGRIDGIFAHASLARSIGRENIATIPGDAVKLAQQGNGAERQRNAMRPSHLHLRGRDRPNCAIEIDLTPFRRTNLPRSRKGQCRQLIVPIQSIRYQQTAPDVSGRFPTINLLILNIFWTKADLVGREAGAARGIRTPDPVITNDVLYQLSYCGEPCGAPGQTGNAPAPDIGQRAALQEPASPGLLSIRRSLTNFGPVLPLAAGFSALNQR